MSAELIISIISLALTTVVGILTLIVNIRIGKINNLEAVHKYEKKITNFELQFKNELWLYDLLESGEFNNYTLKSKKKIFKWWEKYKKKHYVILLHPQVDYRFLSSPGPHWSGSSGLDEKPKGEDAPDPKDLF